MLGSWERCCRPGDLNNRPLSLQARGQSKVARVCCKAREGGWACLSQPVLAGCQSVVFLVWMHHLALSLHHCVQGSPRVAKLAPF